MCYNTLKSIRLNYIFILYLYIFFSFSNLFARDFSQLSAEDKKYILDRFHTSISISDINSNEKLKLYKTKSIIILDYLNAILHRILDNNKELLSLYSKKKEDIEAKFVITNSSTAYTVYDSVFLAFSEYNLLHNFLYDTDAYIAAVFSHEIAHILLRHQAHIFSMESILVQEFYNKYKIDKNTKRDHAFYKKSKKFIESHKDFIKQSRRHEIEADNLGFQLFLNTEFANQHYADHLFSLKKIAHENTPLLLKFYMFKDYLIRMYEGSSYPSTDIEKIRSMFIRYSEETNEKMENYKYSSSFEHFIEYVLFSNNTNIHPNTIWRFWNILKQEPEFSNDSVNHTNITTTEYIRIDLSDFEKLNDIKPLLNKKYSYDDVLNINNKNDPRFYIINALLEDNSNVSYTFFTSTSPIDSIGIIQEDNTVVLRANDVFRATALSLSQDISSLDNVCTRLFSKYSKITQEVLQESSQHYVITAINLYIFMELLKYVIHY